MAELETTVNENTEPAKSETKTEHVETPESAEIARLKRELAAQINKNDSLAKENAEKTKQLRAKQSAEEAAAEEAKEAAEARDKELAELRKKFAVAETSKKVMGFVGDEQTASAVAEYLYGAEDIDAALAAFNKAWTAKEKALRLEYGKIPAPGVGSGEGSTITKAQLDAMTYTQRLEFANKYPDDYNKLMGR